MVCALSESKITKVTELVVVRTICCGLMYQFLSYENILWEHGAGDM
jgi:hypothetical protein